MLIFQQHLCQNKVLTFCSDAPVGLGDLTRQVRFSFIEAFNFGVRMHFIEKINCGQVRWTQVC